jgi:hypothetical protein
VRQIAVDQQQFDLADWRLGMLLFAAIFLVLAMSRQEYKSAILPHLHDLRRRISLGCTGYDEAARQTDLLLHGLTIGNVLQPQITDALNAFTEDQSLIDRCHSEFCALQDILRKMESADSAPSRRSIHDLLESMSALSKKEVEAWQRCDNAVAILFKRSAFLLRMSPDAANDACAFVEEIGKALQSRHEKLRAIQQSVEDIKNSLKAVGKENIQRDVGQEPPDASVLADPDAKP